MNYSENFDLETAIDETKSFLVEQYNSINTIKESVRDLISSAGLVIALLSLLQINLNNLNFNELGYKELLILIALILYVLLIIISVFILSPIKMYTPIEISKETFKILFFNKSPKNILENKLTNCLLATEKNKKVLKKASFFSIAASLIYILIILDLCGSFFIK